MNYAFSQTLTGSLEQVQARVQDALKAEGFGILTEIDVQATLKKKLGVETKPYRILGACNPPLAHQALTLEPLIGLMLPCNVILREEEPGSVQVSAIDPVASMQAVQNPALAGVAAQVREKLQRVIASL